MSNHETDCLITAATSCVCTKPHDAESARYADSDAPCSDGCN
ncbi:MAG TPA: hypothetical protein PK408_05695 [Treponemataceae bacterium]|nr:hypothetical protein [Treponemataceae bacterium]